MPLNWRPKTMRGKVYQAGLQSYLVGPRRSIDSMARETNRLFRPPFFIRGRKATHTWYVKARAHTKELIRALGAFEKFEKSQQVGKVLPEPARLRRTFGKGAAIYEEAGRLLKDAGFGEERKTGDNLVILRALRDGLERLDNSLENRIYNLSRSVEPEKKTKK